MDELAGLPDDARTLALERFHLLQPHLEQNQRLVQARLTSACHDPTAALHRKRHQGYMETVPYPREVRCRTATQQALHHFD
jgi:hypothetical protein